MIQAESQLSKCYGNDGATIIGNCDTYVYMGGNDIETAAAVAQRADVPVKRILNMPVGTNWIFRRGQNPVNGKNFDLEPYWKQKIKGKEVLEKVA
jgi:type IV secretion system protein VirD4